MNVSPLIISIMLACYCSIEPKSHVGALWDSPEGRGAIDWLMSQELIDENARPTSKGKAWVHYICATPLPRMTWVMPPRDEVNDAAELS